jgi:hypothetical protein
LIYIWEQLIVNNEAKKNFSAVMVRELRNNDSPEPQPQGSVWVRAQIIFFFENDAAISHES